MAEQPTEERRPRGVPLGAIILVVIGVLLLLQTTEVVPWALWLELWRFWPVILIAVGINLIFEKRAPLVASLVALGLIAGSVGAAYALTETDVLGSVNVSRVTEELAGANEARINVDFGAGSLTIGSLPEGSVSLMEGKFQGRDADVNISRTGGRATVTVSSEASGFFQSFRDVEWDLSLSRTPEMTIDVDGGAADFRLDLRDLMVRDVQVSVGASSVKIVAPAAAGRVDLVVDAGAASVEIVVPDGVAARVTSSSGLSSLDVDESRFPKSGGIHESPDYDSAENKVDIDLRLGVSSVSVR